MIRQESLLEQELTKEGTTKKQNGAIRNVLRSPEIENLIPKVYLDTTTNYGWWRNSISELLELTRGKNETKNVYISIIYRVEFGVWKLVRRRCQKCDEEMSEDENVR